MELREACRNNFPPILVSRSAHGNESQPKTLLGGNSLPSTISYNSSNKNFDLLCFSGMFLEGFRDALGVFLDDLLGGVWDMFGRFLRDFVRLLDSFREGF